MKLFSALAASARRASMDVMFREELKVAVVSPTEPRRDVELLERELEFRLGLQLRKRASCLLRSCVFRFFGEVVDGVYSYKSTQTDGMYTHATTSEERKRDDLSGFVIFISILSRSLPR